MLRNMDTDPTLEYVPQNERGVDTGPVMVEAREPLPRNTTDELDASDIVVIWSAPPPEDDSGVDWSVERLPADQLLRGGSPPPPDLTLPDEEEEPAGLRGMLNGFFFRMGWIRLA